MITKLIDYGSKVKRLRSARERYVGIINDNLEPQVEHANRYLSEQEEIVKFSAVSAVEGNENLLIGTLSIGYRELEIKFEKNELLFSVNDKAIGLVEDDYGTSIGNKYNYTYEENEGYLNSLGEKFDSETLEQIVGESFS